jgi:hypothetical protein
MSAPALMVTRNPGPRRSGSHVRRSSVKYGPPKQRLGPSFTYVQILAVGLMAAFLSGIFAVGISPSFAAHTLQIHGATFTSESIVRSILAMDDTPNAFRIDTDQAAEQLARLPAVESASVQVQLPSTVVVTLVERQPKLVWVIGDKRYVVDQDGLIFGLVDGAGNPIPSSSGPLASPTDVPPATDTPIDSGPSAGSTASPTPSPTPIPSLKKTAKPKATPTKAATKSGAVPSAAGSATPSAGESAGPSYNASLVPSLVPAPSANLAASSGPRALGLPAVYDRRAADDALGLGGIIDPTNLDAAYRLAGLTPTDVGSTASALAVVLDDAYGFTVSSVPMGWVAQFGFYAPSVRKTTVIPEQVRDLRSTLVQFKEAHVAWVWLVADVSDNHVITYLPR